MKTNLLRCAILTGVLLCILSCSIASAEDSCIKITGARFERLYFDIPLGTYHYRSDEPIELVLEITGENMDGSPVIYIDGRKLKQGWHEEWRYGIRQSNPGSYSFVNFESDYSKIWVRGIIPNANPQDHVIEMVSYKTCKSNKFHAAW